MVPTRPLRKRNAQPIDEEVVATSSFQNHRRQRYSGENSSNDANTSVTKSQPAEKKSKPLKTVENLTENNNYKNVYTRTLDPAISPVSSCCMKKNEKKVNGVASPPTTGETKSSTLCSSETNDNAANSKNLHILPFKDMGKSLTSNKNKDFLHQLNQLCIGRKNSIHTREPIHGPILNHLSRLTVFKAVSPFDRRTTSLAWHPTEQSTIAAGSKGGDIMLWNFDSSKDSYIQGIGAGGSILAMKFRSSKPTQLYTAALDGKVSLQDFQCKHTKVLLDTANRNQWFCSLDVIADEKMIVCGDSLGNVTLMSSEQQEKIWSLKLHRNKVSHAEFCSRDKWLLATASIDKTLKLWDIRNIKNRDGALHVCHHEKPINSAYFDLQTGTKILTTDQHNQIRIYSSPFWELTRIIYHPHRHFQHLTPIKAHWSPVADIITIGRYPDENFPNYSPGERRTIDFFDANTGDLLYKITEQGVVGILSLNQFNKTGEVLASCMGYNILIWKHREEVEHKRQLSQNANKYFNTSSRTINPISCPSPHQPQLGSSSSEGQSTGRKTQTHQPKTKKKESHSSCENKLNSSKYFSKPH